MYRRKITISTRGRGAHDCTAAVAAVVAQSGTDTGLCHLFLCHTSASLMLCENADPAVREDLERFMAQLAPDGDPMFAHDQEGPDDMPAHVRTVLTHSDLTIPVASGRLDLGTWQGVYVWEHRRAGHARTLTISVTG